ncbi:MAG TPA: polysaccharide deacetylase family protein [Acidobacteriota bacterium]|mgnify:CR=1 FL=1|nr:polysaccharide deacetylase family protein [Acidobacteriota bacterium]
MNRLALFLLIFVLCGAFVIQDATPAEKKILLTFENMPATKPLGFWSPREISNMILRALEANKIKAVGFVVGEKIEEDPSSFIVLEDWASRGHILGNQTFGNVDLNELSAEDFLHHAADGQKPIWAASKRFKFNFRYFRFPQLHEGNNARKRKEVRQALLNGGYQIVPVTVKTSDFRFNRPFIDRQKSQASQEDLKSSYLQHVGEMLDYAEKQSTAVFGRQITQILQLRAGIATGHFLEDLISMLRQRGYQFVSLPEALEDPAFQTEETYVGPLGLSFLDRVAATRSLPYDEKHGEINNLEIEKVLGEE